MLTWFFEQPRLTRISLMASLVATVAIIVIWSRYLVLDEGTVVSSTEAAGNSMITLILILVVFCTGCLGGLYQILFKRPRIKGVVSIICGFVPPTVWMTLTWYLQNVAGIVFD